MIATVHLIDVGPRQAIRAVLRKPQPADVPGLRSAEVALLAPLALSGPPPVRQAGLIAFWDSKEAADRFVAADPIGRRFSAGFQARLRPLRAFGSWPGLPSDVPDSRAVPHDGPVVVLTLGRLRLSQAVRFLRTSRPAEKAAATDEGMIWGSAAARPPFVATISVWESSKASAKYAFGRSQPAHSDAIEAQRRKDFHRRSAFIRFAPLHVEGELAGPNPLAASDIGATWEAGSG